MSFQSDFKMKNTSENEVRQRGHNASQKKSVTIETTSAIPAKMPGKRAQRQAKQILYKYRWVLMILLMVAALNYIAGSLFAYSGHDILGEYMPGFLLQSVPIQGNATEILAKYGLNSTCHDLHKEALSAIKRAESQSCRQQIVDVACLNDQGLLYPKKLPNLCPYLKRAETKGQYVGCFQDSFTERLFSGSVHKFPDTNEKELCLKTCYDAGFRYSGLQFALECFCGNEVPSPELKLEDSACNKPCTGNKSQTCGGYLTMNIYTSGIEPMAEPAKVDRVENVRVVFLLTVTGRAVRQVRRLLKKIYHVDNYFMIHVDSRQDYMYRELSQLETKYPNIRLARKRHATIWGGASLAQMLLDCFRELSTLSWKWDYVLNLSESDYPVKDMDCLVKYLSDKRGRNFLKSHGRETKVFVRKQGLDRTFLECENHMWRLGHRYLPAGIRIDGGSDWICLHRDFAEYVSEGLDETIVGLRKVFLHTLLPGESFFHTALRNSKFCATAINNNLHVTNWRRKQGCKCQHRAMVDWCGCSPNDYKESDWDKLRNSRPKDIYFARKFEPIVSQKAINMVDENLLKEEYDPNLTALNDYWQNHFHHLDESPKPRPEMISNAHVLARTHLESKFPKFGFEKVLEITSFQRNDVLQGILILYSAFSGNEVVEIECLVEVKDFSTNLNVHDHELKVSAGTDFDPKEVLFRNVFNAIGPESQPAIMYKLFMEEPEDLILDFVVFNPIGEAVFAHEKSFNDTEEDSIKVSLKKPFMPGKWTVAVTQGRKMKAKMPFLIAPLLEDYVEDAHNLERLHKGSGDILEDLEDLPGLVLKHQVEEFRRKAMENANKRGEELFKWAQRLISQFYDIVKDCSVNYSAALNLKVCDTLDWSSRYSDPKSKISGIDRVSGRFF